jgi:hypothetical protein
LLYCTSRGQGETQSETFLFSVFFYLRVLPVNIPDTVEFTALQWLRGSLPAKKFEIISEECAGTIVFEFVVFYYAGQIVIIPPKWKQAHS